MSQAFKGRSISRTEARILERHLFAVNGQFGEVQWEWAADPCVSGFMIPRGVISDQMGETTKVVMIRNAFWIEIRSDIR